MITNIDFILTPIATNMTVFWQSVQVFTHGLRIQDVFLTQFYSVQISRLFPSYRQQHHGHCQIQKARDNLLGML